MKVIRKHRCSFERQMHEAVEINTDDADIIMNRKSEFNSQKIPRLTLEIGDKALQSDYNGHQLGKREWTDGKSNSQPQLATKRSKPAPAPKTKPKPKVLEGQVDIRTMFMQRTKASETGFDRGGGMEGRESHPLLTLPPWPYPP